MDNRPTVVLGFLGTTLDRGSRGAERWSRWRPTVSVCQQPDLAVARLELFAGARWRGLAESVTADIAAVSPETEVRVHPVEPADPWDFEAVYTALYDFARAYPFDPDAHDYLVHITTGTHVAQICLFLLVESRVIPARLLQSGPGGSPTGRIGVIDLSLQRYDQMARRFEAERVAATAFLKGGIETKNPAFNALVDRIELVALRSTAPMLLTGPTGAGKSRLARRIWELTRARRLLKGPFVDVNCATLRGDGAMAALFGHKRGAFTGAVEARAGLLREADGGILFLDEIGELGLDEQAMLLRALEDKRFLPVGSDKEVASDFRLLAGTNRDLGAEVAAGRFREDLLARLDLWTFALPGLAERPEDIPANVEHELEQLARATGRRVTFNREAYDRFLAFALAAPWPRNFRDLGGAVVRMATLAPGARIDVATVDEEIVRLERTWAGLGAAGLGPAGRARGADAAGRAEAAAGPRAAAAPRDDDEALVRALLGDVALDRFDRVQLADVLRVCRAARSMSEAGRVLFAASRAKRTSVNDADRLRKYLARFGLDWERASGASGVERTRTAEADAAAEEPP